MSIETFINRTQTQIKENSPTILAALGVAGVLTTGVLAHKAGRYYQQQVIEATNVLDPNDRVLTGKEKFEMGWKRHIPAIVIGGTTVACIIASASISNRRHTMLVSAVTLGEAAYREYRDKAEAVMGKAKSEKVVEEIAKDKVAAAEGKELVFLGDDKVIFFDELTGRFFSSSRLDIEKAEIEINRRILGDMYASQNDWYDILGIAHVSEGDNVGWNNDFPLEVVFTATVKDDKPVFALSYRHAPKLGFHRFG